MARMTPILIPKHLQINPAALQAAITKALNDEAESEREDYRRSTADWTDQPNFYIQRQGDHARLIATRDEEFAWVTEGTEGPYPIVAHGRTLAFQANYQRKSVVGQIASRPGGASGPMVYTRQVMHPGIEGTHVNETIAKEHERPFRERLEKELKAALPTK